MRTMEVQEWEQASKETREEAGMCRYYPQTCDHKHDINGLLPCYYDHCLVGLGITEEN